MEFGSLLRLETKILPEELKRHQKDVQEANEAAQAVNYRIVHGKVTEDDLTALDEAQQYFFRIRNQRVPSERVIVLMNKYHIKLPSW